jgi:hypothetical protein
MNNKQRLFEMMEKLNPEFKLNENVVRSTNSDEPTLDLNRKYDVGKRHKPNGLWYEVDNDWVRWCSNEEPDWVRKYDIIIDVDLANILVVDTYEKGIEFQIRFGVERFDENGFYTINWYEVSKAYKGIEIPNIEEVYRDKLLYQDWIYTWQVNSGCIWDLSAIKNYTVKNCDEFNN